MMGLTLFILQRYDQAQKYLYEHPQLKHIELAVEAALKHNNSKEHGVVSIDVFFSAIKGLREFGHQSQATAFRAIVYDIKTRRNFAAYENVLEESLLLWNDNWVDPHFRYDKATQSLRISGDNFSTLGINDKFSRASLLFTIPIKHLDVSDSEVQDLSYLYGSNIESLDIRRTYVRDLSPLRKITSLKSLIMTPHQFSKEVMATLPPQIELISKQ